LDGESGALIDVCRHGFTDDRTSTLACSIGGGLGLRVRSLSPGGSFGIAVTRAHAGPQGRARLSSGTGGRLSSCDETVVEVTCQSRLWPGLTMWPVVQRIFNPGYYLTNATIAGVGQQPGFRPAGLSRVDCETLSGWSGRPT